MKRVFIFLLFLTNAKQKRLSKKDLKLEKSARLQAKMALRYEKALRKSVKMERKLMKKQAERSIYPTMAKQVDFSLSKPEPYLQELFLVIYSQWSYTLFLVCNKIHFICDGSLKKSF